MITLLSLLYYIITYYRDGFQHEGNRQGIDTEQPSDGPLEPDTASANNTRVGTNLHRLVDNTARTPIIDQTPGNPSIDSVHVEQDIKTRPQTPSGPSSDASPVEQDNKTRPQTPSGPSSDASPVEQDNKTRPQTPSGPSSDVSPVEQDNKTRSQTPSGPSSDASPVERDNKTRSQTPSGPSSDASPVERDNKTRSQTPSGPSSDASPVEQDNKTRSHLQDDLSIDAVPVGQDDITRPRTKGEQLIDPLHVRQDDKTRQQTPGDLQDDLSIDAVPVGHDDLSRPQTTGDPSIVVPVGPDDDMYESYYKEKTDGGYSFITQVFSRSKRDEYRNKIAGTDPPEYYDVVILYNEDSDEDAAIEYCEYLNSLKLRYKIPVKAILHSELTCTLPGTSVFRGREEAYDRGTFIFMFMTETFCTNTFDQFFAESALYKTLECKEKQGCLGAIYTVDPDNPGFDIPNYFSNLIRVCANDESKKTENALIKKIESKLFMRANKEKEYIDKM